MSEILSKIWHKPAEPPQPRKHIIIIGAGVTGLTTALKLNSDPAAAQYRITIIASHLPGDESIDYTSPWAGADWSPQATASPTDAEMREYDKRTYDTWTGILETNPIDAKDFGMAFKECRNYWGKEGPETEGHDGRGLWWKNVVKDFEVLDLEKEKGIPEGAVMGVKYQSICLNVPQHLKNLMERVRKAGVDVIKANVNVSGGLEGVVRDARRVLVESNKDVNEELFALVNCTGLGARHFVGNLEAEKLFPIRGQIIIVKGEATMDRTYDDFPSLSSSTDDELTYVIPRPGSGTTVLGGCKQAGNWDPNVDEELNERILERIKKWGLAEELRTKEGERNFEVLRSTVGLRPGRKGGPRVEVEGNEKVDGVWVIHNYGHAGAGYQSSAGCSKKVAKLIGELAGL